MKHTFFSSGTGWRSRRGVALITVLILVVLITSVIVGFLVSSGLQQTAARSYKATAAARLLGDTAVNLVEGQINEATSQGMSYAWASQPGAIRVYKSDSADTEDGAGSLYQIYRLYSALNLTATDAKKMDTSATPPGTLDMPPTTWSGDPAMWVDLNAPAYDEEGNEHYPIFDAGVAANVDGFSLGTPTTSGVSSGVGATAAALGATTTQVPMPVTWLYVLQNGEIIPPDAGGTTVVKFTQSAVQPTSIDPIVGRIAFWTDDDTCKVNINTAGGDGIGNPAGGQTTDPTPIANATFWDTPHFCAPDDVALAQYQPASGEFQRYPGHPATLALHNILNGLGWLDLSSANFYSLTPRYANGGSFGATKIATGATFIPLNANPADRLYTSVGEMLFAGGAPGSTRPLSVLNADTVATRQRVETANFFLTAHSTAPEVTLSGQPRISMWPEIDPSTAFNQKRTPIDQLLAFAATNSGNAYYFTRADPRSSLTDIGLARNQQLLEFLDYFTSAAQPIPGYGSSFDTKYTQAFKRQILTEIFDYIRTINIADSSQSPTLSAPASNPTEYAQPWIDSGMYQGIYEVAPSINNLWPVQTQGFGIYPRLNEAAIQFVAVGAGESASHPAIPLDTNYTAYTKTMIGVGDSGTDPNDSGAPAGPAQDTPIVGDGVKSTVDGTTNTPTQLYPPGNKSAGSTTTMAVQACLLLSFINPAQMLISNGTSAGPGANGSTVPFMSVEVTGLNGFGLGSVATHLNKLGFPSDENMGIGNNQGGVTPTYDWDGIEFTQMLFERISTGADEGTPTAKNPFISQVIPITIGPALTAPLGLTNVYVPTPSAGYSDTMTFGGGTIQIYLYDGLGANTSPTKSGGFGGVPGTVASNGAHLVQEYTITFPAVTTNVPSLVVPLTQSKLSPPPVVTPCGPNMGLVGGTNVLLDGDDRWSDGAYVSLGTGTGDAGLNLTSYVAQGTLPANGGPNNIYIVAPTSTKSSPINTGDVVRSMVLSPAWSDARLLAIGNVPAAAFTTHPNYFSTSVSATTVTPGDNLADDFFDNSGPYYTEQSMVTPFATGALNPNANYLSDGGNAPCLDYPEVTPTLSGTNTIDLYCPPATADWDSGVGEERDGPWINKADEGMVFSEQMQTANITALPYFTFQGFQQYPVGASFFSPNREIPSPGMLGSLSTGVDPTGKNPVPWRTLLFRPNPNHFGDTVFPHDHLILDLFWMPDAEPYAISEQFATAGKVNLNYQIEPFTYITRDTALRAVLNTQKIAYVPSSQASVYKADLTANGTVGAGITAISQVRLPLNVSLTLTQFQDKFDGTYKSENSFLNGATPDLFHSPSQICDMYLVPQAIAGLNISTVSQFASMWYDGLTFGLVGDNVRERPYTNIYGLVTTKSNTYTIHYTVESLKNAEPSKLQNQWDETQGAVLGEYRGSTTIERYIDPNQTLPDFAAQANWGKYTLDGSIVPTPGGGNIQLSDYKWRTVDSHQFAP